MAGQRYTDEFKIEAVIQVAVRGYSVAEVAERLGTTIQSLYTWLKKFGEAKPWDGRKILSTRMLSPKPNSGA